MELLDKGQLCDARGITLALLAEIINVDDSSMALEFAAQQLCEEVDVIFADIDVERAARRIFRIG